MTFYLDADISKTNIELDFSGCPDIEMAWKKNSLPESLFERKTQVVTCVLLVQVLLIIDISKSKNSIKDALKVLPPHVKELSKLEKEVGKNSNSPGFQSSRSIIRIQEIENTMENVSENSDEIDEADMMKQSLILLPNTNSLHKLILQDSRGNIFYGIEMKRLPFLSMTMPLGSKLLLENVKFQRGVALLDCSNVRFLGGHVKQMNRNSRSTLEKYVTENTIK